MLTLLLLFFLGTATSRALPMNITASAAGSKIPMLPPAQLNQPSLNPEDVATFTNMFLNLFKGIADWRNIVAADTVQSMWQSPPIADISHRLFGAQVYKYISNMF